MPAINYKRTKTEVPARNFDTKTLTDDYDIALQDASSVYGVKSFFGGIRDFFKGVAALGTLTATSRIPVTDANGNVTYTTPNAIKNTLGLATTTDLSNYTRIKTLEVADTTVDSLKESLLSNIANFNNGEDILVIRGTQNRGVLKINKQSNIYFSVLFSSHYYSVSELRYNNGTWQDNYTLNGIIENSISYPNISLTLKNDGGAAITQTLNCQATQNKNVINIDFILSGTESAEDKVVYLQPSGLSGSDWRAVGYMIIGNQYKTIFLSSLSNQNIWISDGNGNRLRTQDIVGKTIRGHITYIGSVKIAPQVQTLSLEE